MIGRLTLHLLCSDCRALSVRIKTGKIRRVSEAVCLPPLLPPPAPPPEPAPLFLLPSLSWARRPGSPHPRSEKVRRMRRPLGFCKTPPRVQKRTVAQRTRCWPRCSPPTPSPRSPCPLSTWIWTSLTSEKAKLWKEDILKNVGNQTVDFHTFLITDILQNVFFFSLGRRKRLSKKSCLGISIPLIPPCRTIQSLLRSF